MKSFNSLLALALSSVVLATPIIKRATAPTEIQVLNYALTLEHLENAFYQKFLAQFDTNAFTSAGYPSYVRGRLAQIGSHEAQHVKFLETALAGNATKACEYTFPVKTVQDFVAISQVLEGVGVTAYLGAAQFLHTPAYLTAAGSILTTESRHNAWVNAVPMHSYPWSGAFDTPQTLNEVYSLAAPFIKSCPSTNPALPVKAFPTLTVSPATFTSTSTGSESLTLTFDNASSGKNLVLLKGLETTAVKINGGKATLPKGLMGTIYAVVSKDETASDESVVAGPVILSFPFSSFEQN